MNASSGPDYSPLMTRVLIASLVLGLVTPAFADPAVKTERRRSHVHAAWTFAGLGTVLLGTGIVTGRVAADKYDATFESGDCLRGEGLPHCNVAGFHETSSARSLGDIGTGIGIGGVAFLATAAIVYFAAPQDTITVVPAVGEKHGGVVLSGSF